MIRTIIIDDEPSSINVLSLLLKKSCKDEVRVLATSTSPFIGKTLIEQNQPDLVFLDIEMPGMSGIDLVRSFPTPSFHTVFVTAYDAYAVEAFRLSAIDYLLKPVESGDVVRVVEKVKKQTTTGTSLQVQLDNLQRLLNQRQLSHDANIGIAMADKIVFVKTNNILYCEACGAYTNIFLKDGKRILSSKSLGDFESQLVGHRFFRIHHSILINLSKVKEFQRSDGGFVVMEDDKKL
ncbi:MAG: LytR/AlgR family response regulator transcription factor, partial [Flavisolibacter sp.]